MRSFFMKGVSLGIGLFVGVFLMIVGYAAWTNLPNATSGQKLTSASWNAMVAKINETGAKVDTLSNIPSGAVIAFNSSSCPTGWIPANGSNGTPDLRGEFIRGLDSGRGIDSGRSLASWQVDEFKSHNHTYSSMLNEYGNWSASVVNNYSLSWYTGWNQRTSGNSGGTETRPRNVALLYCVKQ